LVFDFHQNGLKHAIDVLQHFIVPESNDAIAFRLEECCPRGVAFLGVLTSIDFNDQAGINASEVDNEWPDRNLTAEFVTAELTIAEPLP
jgi:hypothetical protein